MCWNVDCMVTGLIPIGSHHLHESAHNPICTWQFVEHFETSVGHEQRSNRPLATHTPSGVFAAGRPVINRLVYDSL